MPKGYKIGIAIAAVIFVIICVAVSNSDRYLSDRYIKLGEYKGLPYTMESTKVTKKDISDRVDSDRSLRATAKEVKQGTVRNGDVVTIRYKGKVDGKEFDGGSSESQTVTIGQGEVPFDRQLDGMTIGKDTVIDIKLPEDFHNREFRNRNAKYNVKVLSRTDYIKPKYDKKFVADMGYKSKSDYESHLAKEIKKSKTEIAENNVRVELLAKVVSASELKKIPDDLVDMEYSKNLSRHAELAKKDNLSWEEFIDEYFHQTEDGFKNSLRKNAQATVKEQLVVRKIARNEGIKVTDSEYRKYLEDLLENTGLSEDEFEKQYGRTLSEYGEDNSIREQLLKEKVSDFLYKNGIEQ